MTAHKEKTVHRKSGQELVQVPRRDVESPSLETGRIEQEEPKELDLALMLALLEAGEVQGCLLC